MNEDVISIIWSVIKTLGSLGGLVSAAFLIWDRATKYKPYARFIQKEANNTAGGSQVICRIYNPNDRIMLVQVNLPNQPQELSLDANDETFLRSGVDKTILIDPNIFVDLDVVCYPDWKSLSHNKVVRVVFKWKYAQPLLFHYWRKKSVLIHKLDFDAISPRSG